MNCLRLYIKCTGFDACTAFTPLNEWKPSPRRSIFLRVFFTSWSLPCCPLKPALVWPFGQKCCAVILFFTCADIHRERSHQSSESNTCWRHLCWVAQSFGGTDCYANTVLFLPKQTPVPLCAERLLHIALTPSVSVTIIPPPPNVAVQLATETETIN